MAGLFSSLFGGSKSEKDVKKIWPRVVEINQHFASYQSLTNDQLRNKTNEFKERIQKHLEEIMQRSPIKPNRPTSFRSMTSLARMPSTRKWTN
jgi:preprotein translocase subunit SecA